MAAQRSGMVFWDVDTQVDFMLPGGKLYVPGAERIIPNLERLTRWAAEHSILVIADMDAHHEGDEEFREYPPHCLVGTPGQRKVPETVLSRQYVIPDDAVELPPDFSSYQQVVIEKDHVDVFTNPNVERLLSMLGRETDIYLYGVVTEVCVRLAAEGLLERGYRLHLVQDAVQHWDPAKGSETLRRVQEKGGRLTTTEQALTSHA